jgi:hypothetical protein
VRATCAAALAVACLPVLQDFEWTLLLSDLIERTSAYPEAIRPVVGPFFADHIMKMPGVERVRAEVVEPPEAVRLQLK